MIFKELIQLWRIMLFNHAFNMVTLNTYADVDMNVNVSSYVAYLQHLPMIVFVETRQKKWF